MVIVDGKVLVLYISIHCGYLIWCSFEIKAGHELASSVRAIGLSEWREGVFGWQYQDVLLELRLALCRKGLIIVFVCCLDHNVILRSDLDVRKRVLAVTLEVQHLLLTQLALSLLLCSSWRWLLIIGQLLLLLIQKGGIILEHAPLYWWILCFCIKLLFISLTEFVLLFQSSQNAITTFIVHGPVLSLYVILIVIWILVNHLSFNFLFNQGVARFVMPRSFNKLLLFESLLSLINNCCKYLKVVLPVNRSELACIQNLPGSFLLFGCIHLYLIPYLVQLIRNFFLFPLNKTVKLLLWWFLMQSLGCFAGRIIRSLGHFCSWIFGTSWWLTTLLC